MMPDAAAPDKFYEELGDIGYEMLLGPYQCWGIVEAYRLSADRGKLERYVKKVLGNLIEGSGMSVELPADGNAVYLVHYQFDTLISRREQGVFNDNSLQFHVPVVVTLTGEQADSFLERSNEPVNQAADGSIRFEASIPVFSYGAYMINVITSNELRGQGMAHAEFRSSQQLCIDDLDKRTAPKRLADIRPLMAPPKMPNAGETLQRQSMIQIWNKHPHKNARKPKTDQEEATGTGFDALSHIFDLITLKQFPHDRDPSRACYQSIIHIRRRVMLRDRVQGSLQEPKPASMHSFIETYWELHGKGRRDDPRLHSCSILINAEHPEADMVKELGLAFKSKVPLDEAGRETKYYELKPTVYIKMNSDKETPAACFEEAQGEGMAYRTDTLGATNGWLLR